MGFEKHEKYNENRKKIWIGIRTEILTRCTQHIRDSNNSMALYSLQYIVLMCR